METDRLNLEPLQEKEDGQLTGGFISVEELSPVLNIFYNGNCDDSDCLINSNCGRGCSTGKCTGSVKAN